MSSKFFSLKVIIIGLLAGLGAVWGIFTSLPDRKLHLVVCDVGQGDALLVSLGIKQMLVDGGPDGSVLECLARHMPFWDRNLEVVVLTHAQGDHMNGLIQVMERYEVDKIIANGLVNKTSGFEKFRDEVIDEEAEVYLPKRGDEIRMGEAVFKILWPVQEVGSAMVWRERDWENTVLGTANIDADLNETSVVGQLRFGNFDALLVGDIGAKIEQALVNDGVLTKVEVLKVAHHGSKYSSSSEFLREIEPNLAVVSVGARNSYGHPTRDTLIRLDTVMAKILRTDELGDVEIVSDGEKYWTVK